MITRGITLRRLLAASILMAGLTSAASAQYGDMLKQAGQDKAKDAAAGAMAPDTGAAGAAAAGAMGGSMTDKATDAATAGGKKAVEAKMGGKDMQGSAMDGGKAAVDKFQGKGADAAVPAGMPAGDMPGTDKTE